MNVESGAGRLQDPMELDGLPPGERLFLHGQVSAARLGPWGVAWFLAPGVGMK